MKLTNQYSYSLNKTSSSFILTGWDSLNGSTFNAREKQGADNHLARGHWYGESCFLHGKVFGLFRLFFISFLTSFLVFFWGLFVYYRKFSCFSKRFIPSNWKVTCWSYMQQCKRKETFLDGESVEEMVTTLHFIKASIRHWVPLSKSKKTKTALSISTKSCQISMIISLKQTSIKVRATLKRKLSTAQRQYSKTLT